MNTQPDPKPGKQAVGELVLQDIQDRIALGKERYGTALQTHNGRDALQDQYEELIDAVMYTKQRILEERDALLALNAAEAIGTPPRPTVVCLCGSTRFWRAFQRQGLAETLAGRIVLSIGAASGTDDEHFGNLPKEEYDGVKEMLDQLHMRKIEMADEVLILNLEGYVGSSTRREYEYAKRLGKVIRWLGPDKALS